MHDFAYCSTYRFFFSFFSYINLILKLFYFYLKTNFDVEIFPFFLSLFPVFAMVETNKYHFYILYKSRWPHKWQKKMHKVGFILISFIILHVIISGKDLMFGSPYSLKLISKTGQNVVERWIYIFTYSFLTLY